MTWTAAALLLAGAASAAGEAQKAGKAAAKQATAAAPVAAAPAAVAGAAAAGAPAGKPLNAPPTPGELALKRGIDAYKAGKMANAVGSLSSAMSKGGLSGSNLARALYYRGLAYRKQGKPAQAIPDLTNALFLPDGLDAAERADATTSRAAAYREAGIADAGGVPAPAAAAASPAADAAPSASAAASPAWQTAAAAPSPSSSAPALNAVPASEAEPAASQSGGSGVGGFFSNLFGGSSSAPTSAPASDVTTASTGQQPAAAVPASAAVSSWSSGTEVSAKAAKGQRTAAAAAPVAPVVADTPAVSPAVAKAKSASGKYKLQVAAVRSRSEAETLAARVSGEHGGKLGDRKPVIEEAVFGNMGTFYRVNVGPYASAGEPDAVCKTLRASGFDCLVVTH